MVKKKQKQRRQQQRQQRRAAKTTQRQKDPGGRKHKVRSPYAVEFDQLEAEAIAGMMVGGSDEFAERFGGVLLYSELLIEEDEFLDLDIDEKIVEAAMAQLPPALTEAIEDLDAIDEYDQALEELAGSILRQAVQDDGFRADLLGRLDQFVARAREDSALRQKWLAAVAVKFLMEQPPDRLSIDALSSCSLLALLVEEAWDRYEESQYLDALEDGEDGSMMWPADGQDSGQPFGEDADEF